MLYFLFCASWLQSSITKSAAFQQRKRYKEMKKFTGISSNERSCVCVCVCVCVQRGVNQPPLAKIKELRLKKEYRQANGNS